MEKLLLILQASGYLNIKKLSSKRICVLTDKNRVSELENISKILSSEYNPKPISASSVGCVKYNDITILVKPLSKQGRGSSGVQNEDTLVSNIQKFLTNPIDIVFTGNKEFKIKNCKDILLVGNDTKNRKKADIILVDVNDSHYPISIKMDSAEIWESSDSYFSEEASKIVDKALRENQVELEEISEGVFKLVPNIVCKPTKQEVFDVVFGSDIHGNGAIVTRTFSNQDFEVKSGVLYVNCSHIITCMEDIDESKDVYFLIRNDKTRKAIKNYPGLRALAVYKSRVSKNVKLIERFK